MTDSVKQAIAGGRIGVPSVVRWYVRTGEATADATARAMLASTAVWLDGEPATVRSLVGDGSSQAVIHASWSSGAAAILTASRGTGETANDLILLGSKGAIYFGRTPEITDS